MSPQEFMQRLAGLVLRTRLHLIAIKRARYLRKMEASLAAIVGAVSIGMCQPAGATVVGFTYIAHIDAIESMLHFPPAGVLPVNVGNAVVGTFAFDTSLPIDTTSIPGAGVYTYQLPVGLVAHHVRFQLPTPVDFFFDNVTTIILNDASLGGVGLPNTVEDEYAVGSDHPVSATAVGLSAGLFLGNLGPAATGVGPFTSLDLPIAPPKLGDFHDVNLWEFTMYSPGSIPFSQAWDITVKGHLVALDVAEIPEPATVLLVAWTLLGLVLVSMRRTDKPEQVSDCSFAPASNRLRPFGA